MFKFVVLFAVFAVVAAAPGYLGYGYPAAVSHVSRYDVHKPTYAAYAPLAYATGYEHAYPVATSYSNRVDVHGAPVATYAHGYGGYGSYGGYGHEYGLW